MSKMHVYYERASTSNFWINFLCKVKVYRSPTLVLSFVWSGRLAHCTQKGIIILFLPIGALKLPIPTFSDAIHACMFVASNPGFPFWILSHMLLQSCETKSGMEILVLRPIARLRRLTKTATSQYNKYHLNISLIRHKQVLSNSSMFYYPAEGPSHYYTTLAIFRTVCPFVQTFFNTKINVTV